MTVSLSFLVFPTLTIFKITGQVFCRKCLNLGLSDVLSRLDSSYGFRGKFTEGTSLSHCIISGYVISVRLTTGDVNLDCLVKVVSARSFHCQVTLFPFPDSLG